MILHFELRVTACFSLSILHNNFPEMKYCVTYFTFYSLYFYKEFLIEL